MGLVYVSVDRKPIAILVNKVLQTLKSISKAVKQILLQTESKSEHRRALLASRASETSEITETTESTSADVVVEVVQVNWREELTKLKEFFPKKVTKSIVCTFKWYSY